MIYNYGKNSQSWSQKLRIGYNGNVYNCPSCRHNEERIVHRIPSLHNLPKTHPYSSEIAIKNRQQVYLLQKYSCFCQSQHKIDQWELSIRLEMPLIPKSEITWRKNIFSHFYCLWVVTVMDSQNITLFRITSNINWTALNAIDFSFKLFFVLDISSPILCFNIWQFF